MPDVAADGVPLGWIAPEISGVKRIATEVT